jgi:hypothetical protein
MRRMCWVVFGEANVYDADELRSTKCCAECGAVLQTVHTHEHSNAALRADAKYERMVAAGTWTGAPRRPLGPHKVRGLLRCANAACAHAHRILDRDVNAAVNILRGFLAMTTVAPAEGAAPASVLPEHMRHVARPGEVRPRPYYLRHDREGETGGGLASRPRQSQEHDGPTRPSRHGSPPRKGGGRNGTRRFTYELFSFLQAASRRPTHFSSPPRGQVPVLRVTEVRVRL